jgi:hypothetical protein
MLKKFVITAHMENGDAWETTRHTFKGMQEVCESILKDSKVVKYVVEEKYYGNE